MSPDMKKVFDESVKKEESPLGKQILHQLEENLEIAGKDQIPFVRIREWPLFLLKSDKKSILKAGSLSEAIHEGVRQGYTEGFLRKSVVRDPIDRVNTKDNTPAVIHYEIVEGDSIDLLVSPKGFGSENMSRVFMLKPGGWNRRSKRSGFDGRPGRRPQCMSPNGDRSWNRRNL